MTHFFTYVYIRTLNTRQLTSLRVLSKSCSIYSRNKILMVMSKVGGKDAFCSG